MSDIKRLNGLNGIGVDKLFSLLYSIEKQWQPSMADDIPNLKNYALKIYQNAIVFGAEEDSEIVGVAAVYANDETGKQAYLTYIALLESYRKKGIGKKLLELAENTAYSNGMKRVKLEVKVNRIDAISFYKRNLYEILEKKDNNSYFMIKELYYDRV